MSSSGSKIIYHNFGPVNTGSPGKARYCQDTYREDWRRFFVIQLLIYLSAKNSGRLADRAEEDMIRDLLLVYWEEIAASGILEEMSVLEKMKLFRSIQVDFPVLEMHGCDGFIVVEG
jgi:hypothetical protein